jgi:hypothetical protein
VTLFARSATANDRRRPAVFCLFFLERNAVFVLFYELLLSCDEVRQPLLLQSSRCHILCKWDLVAIDFN